MLKLTRRQIPDAVKERKDFVNSTGSMRGKTLADKHNLYRPDSQLNEKENARLVADLAIGIVYVIFSYDTPIAWVCADGYVYKVEQRFSYTTSCHSGMLYTL